MSSRADIVAYNRHACIPLLTNTLNRLQNSVDGTVV